MTARQTHQLQTDVFLHSGLRERSCVVEASQIIQIQSVVAVCEHVMMSNRHWGNPRDVPEVGGVGGGARCHISAWLSRRHRPRHIRTCDTESQTDDERQCVQWTTRGAKETITPGGRWIYLGSLPRSLSGNIVEFPANKPFHPDYTGSSLCVTSRFMHCNIMPCYFTCKCTTTVYMKERENESEICPAIVAWGWLMCACGRSRVRCRPMNEGPTSVAIRAPIHESPGFVQLRCQPLQQWGDSSPFRIGVHRYHGSSHHVPIIAKQAANFNKQNAPTNQRGTTLLLQPGAGSDGDQPNYTYLNVGINQPSPSRPQLIVPKRGANNIDNPVQKSYGGNQRRMVNSSSYGSRIYKIFYRLIYNPCCGRKVQYECVVRPHETLIRPQVIYADG
ncbi:hypothetical protein CBL_07547 [Carabus blaptoides fortunei]